MEHGGGGMVVRLSGEDDGERPCLVIEVEDNGEGFDPETARNNTVTRVLGCTSKRGWGLTLIRELMDDVQIHSRPGQTLVRMCKYVESGS
jgi:anti-sigma regulatory factor (Ser/Thr protein kinase)